MNKNPVATKHVLRAILKGIDACAQDPERTARLMVDKGVSPRYDFTLQGLKAIPFNVWRSYNRKSLRFYTLRLREVGMLKSTPNRAYCTPCGLAVLERAKTGIESVIARTRSEQANLALNRSAQKLRFWVPTPLRGAAPG